MKKLYEADMIKLQGNGDCIYYGLAFFPSQVAQGWIGAIGRATLKACWNDVIQ